MRNQMTLGQMIDVLERKDPTADVQFSFVGMVPTGVSSYRGYYDQLAIGYESKYPRPKVADVLTMLKDADGQTFTGYKGGEYTMDRDTAVWVANNGEVGGTGIIDIIDGEYAVILQTAIVD